MNVQLRDSMAFMDTQKSPDSIVRPTEMAQRLGVSRSTLWRMRRRAEFPEPLRISAGAVGWREATIREWFDHRDQEVVRRSAS